MNGAVAAVAAERFGAPAELPPLRLTATFAPLPKQPPAPALADRGAEPNAAKPARVRPGAPEPLIIDVQQALAALRVKDGSAAPP